MTIYRACWSAAKGLCILLFRPKFDGPQNVPTGTGLILASNHASYVDPVLIGVATTRELSYVTKREFFTVPLLGPLVAKLNCIPIDRGKGDRQGLAAIERRLKQGWAMFLSPEGTRNKSPRLLSPKLGVGMLSRRAGVPVVPVYVHGTRNVWKSMIGLDRVVVRFGEPMWFEPEDLPSNKREASQFISNEVMQCIRDLRSGERKAGSSPGSF
jgi:1-acyl-sn-glycerol-3-phosphate acyltransferase